MDFSKLIAFAGNQQKDSTTKKPQFLKTKLSAPKKEVKQKKGVQSAAVQAFLKKQEDEAKKKVEEEKKKKAALLQARQEVKGANRRVNAMTRTTKENMKVLDDEEEGIDRPCFGPKQRSANTVSKNYAQIQRELLEKMNRVKVKVTETKLTKRSRDKDSTTAKKEKDVIDPKTNELVSDSDSSEDEGKQVALSSMEERMAEYRERKFEVKQSNLSEEDDDDEEDYSMYRQANREKKARKRKEKERDRGKEKDRNRDRPRDKHKHKDKHKRDKHKRDKEKRMKSGRLENGEKRAADAPREPKKKTFIRRNPNPAHKPLSFDDLLALAAKKKDEPVPMPSTGPIPKIKKKKPEEERPMTQEEKDRIARRSTKEYQDWLKYGKPLPGSQNDSQTSRSSEVHNRSPGGGASERGAGGPANKKEYSSPLKPPQRPSATPAKLPGSRYNTTNNNVLVCGPTSEGEAGASGSSSGKGFRRGAPSGRPGPPPDKAQNPWDRIYGNIPKSRPKPHPAKRQRMEEEYDDEEEEDYSDLDDFIDDDGDGQDYSSAIKDIFRYDKSKYRDEDEEDLRGMESTFAQQMNEERVSKRMGIKEDLEDMRREAEEEKRRKMMMKKKKMKH